MATYINGFGGSIMFASATLPVESWDLTVNGEAVDTTNTADAGWESNILGAKSWEGSAKGFWDSAAVPTGAAGYVAGAAGTITLPVGSSGKSYTGSCRLTSIKVGNPVKGAVSFEVSFKGNGALTYAS